VLIRLLENDIVANRKSIDRNKNKTKKKEEGNKKKERKKE
jgi:hypothetical protein